LNSKKIEGRNKTLG